MVGDPTNKDQLLNILIYFKCTLISEEVYDKCVEELKLFVLYIQEVMVVDRASHSELEKELLYLVNGF
jgi:hypothetical protein